MQNFQLIALQMDVVWQDPAGNREKINRILAQEKEPADLILLPEMFSTGYDKDPAPIAEPMKGPTHLWMLETARSQMAVVMGSMVIAEGDLFYNRMLIAFPDGRTITYDKRHPFSFALEHEHYAPGESFRTFEWRGWRICPMICYDLRFPVWSRQRPEQQYDLLVYVANWPEARVSHWSTLLAARAIENQAYVAGLNRVGTDGNGLVYNGASAIHDPLGKLLAHEVGEETVLRASLERSSLEDYRAKFPAWQDADKFQIL